MGVDLLELVGDERVVEIGCGPGVAVRLMAQRLPRGQVFGIDPSGVMLRQAAKRNRAAIARGEVHLRVGSVSQLEWEDAFFDAALSLNNVALWDPLRACLREVRRVLKPSSRITIGASQWAASGQEKPLERLGNEVPEELATAGFSEIRKQERRHLIGLALYFTAQA